MKSQAFSAAVILSLGLLTACNRQDSASAGGGQLSVGVAFDTLESEYWVVGFEALRAELAKRDIKMVEAIANGDSNRQLQQVRNFVTRKVDGIVFVPKDAHTCLPAIKAANEAGIPIVLFNRPAAEAPGVKSTAVVADNRKLARETVAFMVEQARKTGKKHKAMVIVGDLGDMNAIGRKDGFYDAVKGQEAIIEVVAEVPSEWNQEKTRSGVVNALQANPDISFIFLSSDFLFPSVVAALKSANKYHQIGQPGHVILGGFDGAANAYQMLVDGYLDADGVQDVQFEVEQTVQALLDGLAKKEPNHRLRPPKPRWQRDSSSAPCSPNTSSCG
jgi:ABC-type sugar transport system substrate-binding protein